MKMSNFNDEIDLIKFARVALCSKRGLTILFLSVLITALAGFIIPMPYQASAIAIIRIGSISEPLLSEAEVQYKLTDSHSILQVARDLNLRLGEKEVQGIAKITDINNTGKIKLSVEYAIPQTAVAICNGLAQSFVCEGSAIFKEKIGLLEEQIQGLERINADNKNKISKLKSKIVVKRGRPNSLFFQNTTMNYYKAEHLYLADKIYKLKDRLINIKNDIFQDDESDGTRGKFFLNDAIKKYEELDRYYLDRIETSDKKPVNLSLQNDLMHYEEKYLSLFEKIFLLREQIALAKDFRIISPASISFRQVQLEKIRQAALILGIGLMVGFLIILLEEYPPKIFKKYLVYGQSKK